MILNTRWTLWCAEKAVFPHPAILEHTGDHANGTDNLRYMLLRSPTDELDSQNMEAHPQAYSGCHAPQPASVHVHALSFGNREVDSYPGLPVIEPYRQSNESGEFTSLCLDYDQAQFQPSAKVSLPANTSPRILQARIHHPSSGSPSRGQQTQPGTEENDINQNQFGSTDEKNELLRVIDSLAHFDPDISNESPDDCEYNDDDSPPGSEVDENVLDVDDQKTEAERQAEKRKAKRFRLTHTQTRFLQNEFNRQPHPDAAHRLRLSKLIPGLSPRQVQVWFQNRRAKLKRLPIDDRERILRSRALPKYFDYTSAPLVRPYGIAVVQQDARSTIKLGHGSYPFGFGHGNEGSPSQRTVSAFSGFEVTPRSGLGLISPTPLYNSQSCVSQLSKSRNIQAAPSTRFSRFQIAPNTYQTPPCSPINRSDTRLKNNKEELSPSLRLPATQEFLNQPPEFEGVSRLQPHIQNSTSDYFKENPALSISKKLVKGSRCYPSLTQQQRKEEVDDFSAHGYSALQANFSDLDFPSEQHQTRDATLLLPEKCGLESENPYLSPAFSSSSYVDHSPQNPHFYSQVATQDDSLLYSAPRSLGLQLQLNDDARCIYSQQSGTGTHGR